jgi:hypothetical protein
MNTQTPTPVNPDTKLTLTLEAQHWNFIMQTLNDTPLPYRISATLIPLMMEQLQTAAGQVGGQAGRTEGNGLDNHPPGEFDRPVN